MKKNKITIIITMTLTCILFISILSPFAVCNVTEQKNYPLNINSFVTFISKSTGLEIPDKDEGDTELELADINNDGNLDIISVGDHGSPYVGSGQHGIMVWLGDGQGTWNVSQVGNFGYGGIEAGDLNLDGHLDVVWGIHHNYGVAGFGDTLIGAALGDGTGSNWIPWATGLGTAGEDWGMFETDLADFDCNGLLDIISQSFGCCNGYHLYRNNGDGTWTHMWSYTDWNTYNNLETADFNSDGYPDFVGARDGTFVFLGDGAFGFTLTQNGLPTSNWQGLDCGDMNNDGCDDLVIGYGSSGVRCYKFDKQNNDWDLTSNGLPTSGNFYPQFGDINGDGFLDIVAYSEPTGHVYLGNGNGNWVADATFNMPSPGEFSAFVVDGDFDHDGREDVVIQAAQGSWPSYQNQLKAFSPWLEPTQLSAYVSLPHGGETYRSGSIRKIRWLSAVPSTQGESSVDIQISLNGDSGPWDTIVSDIPNNGCYQWLVNTGGSENCRIKIIVSTSSSTVSAISLSDFKIIGFNVDAHGPYHGFVNESIQFTGSAENGTPPYEYLWNFGDGSTSDEQNPTHIYDYEGNYTVTLSVTDGDDVTIIDQTWALIISVSPPPTAPIIKGPNKGKPGIEYTYSFNSTDESNDYLIYFIRWGDDTEDIISGPSGTEVSASHIWTNKGNFTISAKAKNVFGAESSWSKFSVNIPRNRILYNLPSFQFLKQFLNKLKIIFCIIQIL